MTEGPISESDKSPRGADATPVSARMTGAAGGSEPRGEVAGGGWRIGLLISAGVAFGIYAGKGWVITLAVISVMIFLHELGHYLTAKWSGMKVTEFFLFFGPKLWSFRWGETEYGIKLIPLGAYVRIIGMNNLDECPPEDEHRTFRQQSFPKRLLVLSAGSLMHFLQAFLLFLVAFSWLGVRANSDEAQRLGARTDASSWSIEAVTPNSGAAAAGIRVGDRIVRIDGEVVREFEGIGTLIKGRIGDELEIVVDRDGREVRLDATIGRHPDDRDRAMLGVTWDPAALPPVTGAPARSVVVAGEYTAATIRDTIGAVGGLLTGGLGDFASNVIDGGSDSGPAVTGGGASGGRPANEGDENRVISIFGVARIGASLSEEGMSDFLMLFGLVNIGIGVLNLLPLLPLDGGHVAVAIYERVRSIGGRRYMADVSRLLPLTYAVFMFLILLGVSAIYLDIVDPVGVG